MTRLRLSSTGGSPDQHGRTYTVLLDRGTYIGTVLEWTGGCVGFPNTQALGVTDCRTRTCRSPEGAARAAYRIWVELGGDP